MATNSVIAPISPPEVLASDLCWLLSMANQRQKSQFDAALTATGLTPRKHQVLATALGQSHTQTELARLVGLDKTTMMVTLDELERDGLAQRRPQPGDRRARIVAVTDAGEAALSVADATFADVTERVLSVIPDDERAVFLRALERLACPGCVESRESVVGCTDATPVSS